MVDAILYMLPQLGYTCIFNFIIKLNIFFLKLNHFYIYHWSVQMERQMNTRGMEKVPTIEAIRPFWKERG